MSEISLIPYTVGLVTTTIAAVEEAALIQRSIPQHKRRGFWEAYQPFRQRLDNQAVEIDVDLIFNQVHEQTASQTVQCWDQ